MTHPQNPTPDPAAAPPQPYADPAQQFAAPAYGAPQADQQHAAPQYGAPYGAPGQPDPNQYAAPGASYGAPPAGPKTPGLAIAALVVGILSLVFCWVPVAGAVGGVVAVILGVLAMRKPGGKGLGIGGLVTGGLALLAGLVVTIITFVAIGQVNQAAEEWDQAIEDLETSGGVTVEEDAEEPVDEEQPVAEEPAGPAGLGTRENPATPGVDVITFSDDAGPLWEVSVGAANFDAWPAIQAENQFNPAPAEGNVYVTLPVTATYQGAETGTPFFDLTFQFVAADGRTFDQTFVVVPNDLSNVSELYAGGVGQGDIVFEIPADALAGGTWSVEAGFMSDTMFFAAL